MSMTKKTHKVMTADELRNKIEEKYGKIEAQPTTLKDKLLKELNK